MLSRIPLVDIWSGLSSSLCHWDPSAISSLLLLCHNDNVVLLPQDTGTVPGGSATEIAMVATRSSVTNISRKVAIMCLTTLLVAADVAVVPDRYY
jgi:hypothetical protein